MYFTPDINDSCEALTVVFTDHTTIQSGNLVYWNWDFSDPLAATTHPLAAHTFQYAGVYDITLNSYFR